jgi:hypothetical protein
MAKRYIIQKREIKESHGKRPHLMGPYRTLYSDIKPPFELSDKEKIEANLLRNYGEGRYQVKSVGKEEGEKKSKITMHFSGDIERYKPRSKEWTKSERLQIVHFRRRTHKEKIFALIGFMVAFLISFWLLLVSLASGLDSSLGVVAAIIVIVVFITAIFFIDMIFFHTE